MQPGLLPEEYTDDSASAEAARENAGEVSHTPAEQLERIPTASNEDVPEAERVDGGASTDGSRQSNTSSDRLADRRAGQNAGSNSTSSSAPGPAETPGSSSHTGGKAKVSMQGAARNALLKKFGIGGGIGGIVLSGVLGFGWLADHALVEIVHVVTRAVDKRLDHEVTQRGPAELKAIFKEASPEEGDQNTGDPIADANHNFSMDQFKEDMGIVDTDYDASGAVVAFTLSDGTRLSVSDDTLDDPDSPLMTHIESRFPGLDFMRLSDRWQEADGDWGVDRDFLPPADEPVSDDQAQVDQQVDSAFTAEEEGTNATGSTETSDEEDEAKSDLEDSVSTADEGTTGAFGAANDAMSLCGAVGISESMHKDMWIIRAAQVIRVAAGIVLDTGHQEQDNDLHASSLAAIMKLIEGFGKAGGWQVDSGVKGATVSSKEQGEFGASPTGDLATVTGAIDNPATTTVCNPINSTVKALGPAGVAVPGILDVAENIAGPEESAATDALTTVGLSVVQNEALGKIMGYLANIATKAATKPLLNVATMSGADLMDATTSGYDIFGNFAGEEENGGAALNGTQASQMNQEADAQDIHEAQQKGLAYQLFSINDDHSLASDLILKTPTSIGGVASGFNSAMAVISSPFSRSQLAAIGSFISDQIPEIEAAGDSSNDPLGWGATQFGLPDSLLQQYPDPEANEQWIVNYLCSQPGEAGDQPGLYNGDCPAGHSSAGNSASELTDQNDDHNDPYHDYVRECFTNPNDNPDDPDASDSAATDPNCQLDTHGTSSEPDLYDRFRVYRFDLGIANMDTSYNNSTDDQNPNGPVTPPPGPASGGVSGSGLPSGNAQSLAQDILANSKIGYEFDAKTDMQDAANGQPGTCHVPLATSLLQLLDYLSKDGTTFSISSLESSCTGHDGAASGPMEDPHYAGRAADIVNVDGDPTASSGTGRTANDVKVMQDLAPLMPPSPNTTNWTLWSGFGQIGCGPEPDPTLPAGIHQFSDICSHLHIQVSQ